MYCGCELCTMTDHYLEQYLAEEYDVDITNEMVTDDILEDINEAIENNDYVEDSELYIDNELAAILHDLREYCSTIEFQSFYKHQYLRFPEVTSHKIRRTTDDHRSKPLLRNILEDDQFDKLEVLGDQLLTMAHNRLETVLSNADELEEQYRSIDIFLAYCEKLLDERRFSSLGKKHLSVPVSRDGSVSSSPDKEMYWNNVEKIFMEDEEDDPIHELSQYTISTPMELYTYFEFTENMTA